MTPTTWFDPISERWIIPRRQVPVPEVEGRPTCLLVSEAYIDALADAVRRLHPASGRGLQRPDKGRWP